MVLEDEEKEEEGSVASFVVHSRMEEKRREKRGCNKRDEGKMNKNDGETEGVYK